MTQTLYSQTYENLTTKDKDEAKTINLRLEAFDVEYHNETQVALDISENYSLDASATAVIFVKTEDMRSTFQFSAGNLNLTDRTDFSDNDRLNFYVLDKSDSSGTDFGVNPTWRWDCSAEDTDASYIINVAHAMMDASGSFPYHKSDGFGEEGPIQTYHNSFLSVSNDERQRFALVKHDFVRHIIEEAYGGVAVIHNLDELCKSFEDGGLNGWNTIRQNLKAASNHQRIYDGKTGGQNYNVTNNTANPCRSLFNQLRLRNPDRFDPSGTLSASIENRIFKTYEAQPLPFIHGDILEFTFKASTIDISAADPKNPNTIAVPARTYRVKLCCVDGLGNNNEYNTLPPVDNYDFGATYYDSSINSLHNTDEAHRVEAKLENQRFYEINKNGEGPGPVSGAQVIIDEDLAAQTFNLITKTNVPKTDYNIDYVMGVNGLNLTVQYEDPNDNEIIVFTTADTGINIEGQTSYFLYNDGETTFTDSSGNVLSNGDVPIVKVVEILRTGDSQKRYMLLNNAGEILSSTGILSHLDIGNTGSVDLKILTQPKNSDGSEVVLNGKNPDNEFDFGTVGSATEFAGPYTNTHYLRIDTSAVILDDSLNIMVFATLDNDSAIVKLTNISEYGTDSQGQHGKPGRYYNCDIEPADPVPLISSTGNRVYLYTWTVDADTAVLVYNLF